MNRSEQSPSVRLSEELEQLKLTSVKSTGTVIGKGSYGRVIQVYVHGTLCAAKEVHPIFVEQVTARDFEATKHSFLSECVKASRILHPNVVQMLGVHYPSPEAKLPWLVMELMETSLKSFLEKYNNEKFPLNIKLSMLLDTAQGLEFLHAQDIVHRDLSSNNVLLTKQLVAKVADLGVAKVIEHNKMKTQTQTPGTLYFMPPEALSVRPRYGKPIDVFSLACIALHVVSHKWPEPKDRVEEDPITHAMTALTEVQRREEYLQSCSSLPLKKLIISCLHNQPDQRPDISVVCKILKSLKATEDQQAPNTGNNSVELLDAVRQAQLENQELRKTFDERMDQQLHKLKEENNLLHQQLHTKDQQLKKFAIQAKDQNIKVMEQFLQEREQYQYHIQMALSAQEQMFKTMNQIKNFGYERELTILSCLSASEQNDVLEKMIKSDKCEHSYICQLLMAVYHLPTTRNSEVLVQLVREHELSVGACVDVAMNNDNIQSLTFECMVCFESHGPNKMVKMILCDDMVCQECFVNHYSLMIKEKSVKYLYCLACGKPDMLSEEVDTQDYLQKFSALVQTYFSEDQYNMFMQKLAEHTMLKDPNFRWCTRCSSGCVYERPKQRVECPECRQQMCFYCKRSWEEQHGGLSCEEFAAWKKDNDPELQAQGLAAYLNEEGIECPACKFKFALDRGGSMHYRCNQCPAQFCSGCSELFRKSQDCTKYQSCRNKGLHAHHPRNCLFYLRDEDVDNLQKLLNDNNIEYDTDRSQGQVNTEVAKEMQAIRGRQATGPVVATPTLKCYLMLQKEVPDGVPKDEECGDAVESGHAGLCWKHYKEYLVYKINQKHIDPISLYGTDRLRVILMRNEVKVPDQQKGEGKEQYAERLRQVIQEKLPLPAILARI